MQKMWNQIFAKKFRKYISTFMWNAYHNTILAKTGLSDSPKNVTPSEITTYL